MSSISLLYCHYNFKSKKKDKFMAFLFHYIPVFWGKVNFFLFIYFTEFKLKNILVPQNELFLEEFGAMASASHQKRYVACLSTGFSLFKQ